MQKYFIKLRMKDFQLVYPYQYQYQKSILRKKNIKIFQN